MGGITMNENLDLTKILKGCPKGTKLYSTVNGEVIFQNVASFSCDYPITTTAYNKNANSTKKVCFAKDGRYMLDYDGECVLFPSKDQRDWSKFERFWDKPKVEKFDPKTLQPFDKVLGFYEAEGGNWECALFSHLIGKERSAVCAGMIYNKYIPYNEETKHLVGTSDDCPEYYRWWEK